MLILGRALSKIQGRRQMKKLLGAVGVILVVAGVAVVAYFKIGQSSDGGFVASDEIRWVGCGISKKAFMSGLTDAYEKKTGIRISLEGGGATRGIRDVAAGKADMGGSCRHLLPVLEEKNAKLVHVGWDALVVITNPSNPVTDISFENVKAVFRGRIRNWKELGGLDMQIKVAARQGKISGVGRMVRELLFKDPEYEFGPDVIRMKSSGPIEKFVQEEKGAIAFTGVSSAKKRKVHMLKIQGHAPTNENIANGSYILYRPLYLVTSRIPSPAVTEFVKFARSEEGQQIIADEGTVTVKQGSGLWSPYRKSMRQVKAKLGSY